MANTGNYGDFTYYLNREGQGDSKEPESVLGRTPEAQTIKDNQAASPRQEPEQHHASAQHSESGTPTTSQVASASHEKSAKLTRLTQQIKKSIQTHEFASVGIAFGIGFVLSRILKK